MYSSIINSLIKSQIKINVIIVFSIEDINFELKLPNELLDQIEKFYINPFKGNGEPFSQKIKLPQISKIQFNIRSK